MDFILFDNNYKAMIEWASEMVLRFCIEFRKVRILPK